MTRAPTSSDDRLKISAAWVMVAWVLGSGFVTVLFLVGGMKFAPKDDTKVAIDSLAANVKTAIHGIDRVEKRIDLLVRYKTCDSLDFDMIRGARRHNRRP